MVCAAARSCFLQLSAFSSSSLVPQPLGFSRTSACGPPTGTCFLPKWDGVEVVTDRDACDCQGWGRRQQLTEVCKPTPAGATSNVFWGWKLMHGERGYNGSPALHASLNSGASMASSRSIQVCGAPHSCPLRLSPHSQQQSSPQVPLQTPQSSIQSPSAPVDTCFRLGNAGLWHGPSV